MLSDNDQPNYGGESVVGTTVGVTIQIYHTLHLQACDIYVK